jgi:hypothetical protein
MLRRSEEPMIRRSCLALLVLVPALAWAQDEGGETPPPPSTEQRAPRRPLRDLRLAAAPEGWQAPQAQGEARGRRRFLAEYTLPVAAGSTEAPKVTVLAMGPRQAQSFDEYRGRLVAGWTKPDGSAVTQTDQTVATRKEGDLEIKTSEHAGSFAPARGGEKKDGMKLLAVWVRQGEDRWSIWLMGPAAGVDQAKDAFLAWVDTAQPGDPLPAGPGNNSGGQGGGGQGGGEGGGSGPY